MKLLRHRQQTTARAIIQQTCTDKKLKNVSDGERRKFMSPRQFLPQFTIKVMIVKYIGHRDQRASTN